MTDSIASDGRLGRLRSIHPGWILVVLDVFGLLIAGYLSVVELGGGVPVCGPLHGCETVATIQYARIGGIPVAVFGVVLSLILVTLALAWIRTDNPVLLEAWRALRIEARTMISVIKAHSDLLEIAECHQLIIDAFASDDPLAVGKELRRHIERFLGELVADSQPEDLPVPS